MRLKLIKSKRTLTLRDRFKQNTAYGKMVHKDPANAHVSSSTRAAAQVATVTQEQPTPPRAPSAVKEEAIARTIVVLQSAGLQKYFIVCKRSEEESKRVVQRCAQFIVWTYFSDHGVEIIATTATVTEWFQTLLTDKYSMLMDYSEHLIRKRHLQPSTVRSYTTDVEKCFAWLTLFAPSTMRMPMNANDGIRAVAVAVRANQAYEQRSVRSHNTWQEQIQQRKVPVGGLAALQTAVLEEVPWGLAVRQRDIDDAAYRRYMQLLISSIYVFGANGRQSGVADVRVKQVNELITSGYTTTTKFKTNTKYGYQPITLGGVAKKLFVHYVDVVRPQVCRAAVLPDDVLWLTYRGDPDLQIGRLVTHFFIRQCGLTVTTTTIRGLVETSMHQKFRNGEISEVERTAVQNINGHTSETTRDYYLLEDRIEDVANARNAFGVADLEDFDVAEAVDHAAAALDGIVGESDDEDLAPPPPPPYAPPVSMRAQPLPLSMVRGVTLAPYHATQFDTASPPVRFPGSTPSTSVPFPGSTAQWSPPPHRWAVAPQLDWGTAHPDYQTAKPTAQWTHEEKQYLGEWCARYEQAYPESKNVIANCLKELPRDPRAVAIFHAHHTLNGGRLRHGLRQYKSDQEDEAKMRMLRTHTDRLHETMY